MEGRGLGKWGQGTARWVSMVSMAGMDESHELTHAQAPLIMLTQGQVCQTVSCTKTAIERRC